MKRYLKRKRGLQRERERERPITFMHLKKKLKQSIEPSSGIISNFFNFSKNTVIYFSCYYFLVLCTFRITIKPQNHLFLKKNRINLKKLFSFKIQ